MDEELRMFCIALLNFSGHKCLLYFGNFILCSKHFYCFLKEQGTKRTDVVVMG